MYLELNPLLLDTDKSKYNKLMSTPSAFLRKRGFVSVQYNVSPFRTSKAIKNIKGHFYIFFKSSDACPHQSFQLYHLWVNLNLWDGPFNRLREDESSQGKVVSQWEMSWAVRHCLSRVSQHVRHLLSDFSETTFTKNRR